MVDDRLNDVMVIAFQRGRLLTVEEAEKVIEGLDPDYTDDDVMRLVGELPEDLPQAA